MPALSMLIKPASGKCNLRCKYCFYHDLSTYREHSDYGLMSEETLQNLIKKAFDYATGSVIFAFQGGEPTLRGLSFYKKVVALERKYNKNNIIVQNSIQTNGTLLDEEWARFLADNHFLVGLSLDGIKKTHDLMRVDQNGNGTFEKVYASAKLLERYGVDYNILLVVNEFVANKAEEIYSFFRDNGFTYVQPIPCLDPLEEENGYTSYSLKVESYAKFLKVFFRNWHEDLMSNRLSVVRLFDNYLAILTGNEPEMCSAQGRCICQFAIEADGSAYPCDFYVTDRWYAGNVNSSSLGEIRNSLPVREFIAMSEKIDPACKGCKYFPLCHGGCRRNREQLGKKELGLNYFCEAYKEFFEYSLPLYRQIIDKYMG